MTATIGDLNGKYYGTPILITLDDGTKAEIEVWIHNGKCEASKRYLEDCGCKTTEEACREEFICDRHYESAICYKICTLIVNAINKAA
jgi:hypothetical protein